jgi:hypothetical protein
MSEREKSANTTRAKVRAVEDVFANSSGKIVPIGIAQARSKIGIINLSYNVRRLA